MTRRAFTALTLAGAAAPQTVHRPATPAAKPDSIEILEVEPDRADHRIAWGGGPQQFGELRIPQGAGPFPVVINIHGGFWRSQYDLRHAGHLCVALKQKGIATWNIEYRRIGQPGGGYPGTMEDALSAVRHVLRLCAQYPLDARRMVLMGHSAGGHLALYVAKQFDEVRGVIALAPVADLRRAHDLGLGRGVVRLLMGGSPGEVGSRYREASPIERVPVRVPQVVIHGTKDDTVPVEISRRYVAAAKEAGDSAELVELKESGHFELIDPRTQEWATVERSVMAFLGMGIGALSQ